MSEPERFNDSGVSVYEFSDVFWVVCPQCGRCAVVRREPGERRATVSCTGCGYAKRHDAGTQVVGGPFDGFFRLPLWLQTGCVGETLWANNPQHLDFLQDYVAAKLRERPADTAASPYRNKLMASRLPRWMTGAKNRDKVRRGLELLTSRVAEARS